MGKETIVSPVDGEIIELENVLDDVFSSGVMGDGFGVIPTSKNFYSPVSGKVENAYKTGHAYTIVSDDGLDVLIHIGIDTVELEGEYFDSKISSGECLKKGDIIVEFFNKYREYTNEIANMTIEDAKGDKTLEYTKN